MVSGSGSGGVTAWPTLTITGELLSGRGYLILHAHL